MMQWREKAEWLRKKGYPLVIRSGGTDIDPTDEEEVNRTWSAFIDGEGYRRYGKTIKEAVEGVYDIVVKNPPTVPDRYGWLIEAIEAEDIGEYLEDVLLTLVRELQRRPDAPGMINWFEMGLSRKQIAHILKLSAEDIFWRLTAWDKRRIGSMKLMEADLEQLAQLREEKWKERNTRERTLDDDMAHLDRLLKRAREQEVGDEEED